MKNFSGLVLIVGIIRRNFYRKYQSLQPAKMIEYYFSLVQYEDLIKSSFTHNPSQDNQSQRKKTSSEPKQGVEKFSLKRGFPFFGKGNLALLVAILFFYINKSSWSEEGGPVVLLFAFAWEAAIILLSFFACFKEREESSPVKKVRPA
ncbi:hypothetical protein [Cytobacillus oceanisediminis]|uniref:hypothetical protein n=1 Tax=Cytobacillus oceanisediminis TaxID=665099 RepID=UPI000D71D88F|nr:hypothetical protein [Cytobacillus oceanisediminis]